MQSKLKSKDRFEIELAGNIFKNIQKKIRGIKLKLLF